MSAQPGPVRAAGIAPSPRALLEMGARAGDPSQRPAGPCSAASLAPAQGLEAASPSSSRQPLPRCRASSPMPTHTVCLCLSAKAGVCPDPATEEANCTVGCQSDGDCESTLKCCPAACGTACQEPDGNGPPPRPRGCCKPCSRQLTAPGLPGLGSSVGPGLPLCLAAARLRGPAGSGCALAGRPPGTAHPLPWLVLATLAPSSSQQHGGFPRGPLAAQPRQPRTLHYSTSRPSAWGASPRGTIPSPAATCWGALTVPESSLGRRTQELGRDDDVMW